MKYHPKNEIDALVHEITILGKGAYKKNTVKSLLKLKPGSLKMIRDVLIGKGIVNVLDGEKAGKYKR